MFWLDNLRVQNIAECYPIRGPRSQNGNMLKIFLNTTDLTPSFKSCCKVMN